MDFDQHANLGIAVKEAVSAVHAPRNKFKRGTGKVVQRFLDVPVRDLICLIFTVVKNQYTA